MSSAKAAARRALFRLRLRFARSPTPYERFAGGLRWWPLGLPRLWKPARPARAVCYLLWRYPALVEAMIQREIEALRRAGLRITVLADEPEPGTEPLSPLAGSDVEFLEPADRERVLGYLRRFLLCRPLRTANLFVYVVSRRYGPAKSLSEDRRMFLRAIHVAGRLVAARIDHLHAPWAGREAFVALVASRLAGIPYSVYARAYELHRPDAVWALPEKLGHASFAATNSRFNQEHMARLLGGPAGRVHLIYEGIDPEELRPPAGRTVVDGQPVVLSVGRLVPQKGFEFLLEACASLRERGVRFRCEIAGSAQERHVNYSVSLRRLHARLGLEDTVRFVGERPFGELRNAYASADVFVLPCVVPPGETHDVTPNVLIEAMAMELPVISTPVAGVPELVDHGTNGLLVAPGDAGALADALELLLTSPALRRELGRAGREKVLARFDIRSNAQEFLCLFRGEPASHVSPVATERLGARMIPLDPTPPQ